MNDTATTSANSANPTKAAANTAHEIRCYEPSMSKKTTC
jgi:hypothetical protein